MLRFHKLALISSKLFHLSKNVKQPSNISKLTRILAGSGCLTAGCCFSKQPDEEELLDNVKNKQENFPKIRKKEHALNSSPNQYASNSTDMKRSFESINDITVRDDNYENSLRASDVHNKRTKVDIIGKTCDENTPQELSNIEASTHASTEPPKELLKNLDVQAEKTKRHRPNYFVAVKISDDQIRQTLTELQAHIVEKDERLKKSMIELKTLHITLMVMYIGDTETHARAMKTLEKIHQEHDEDMSRNPVKLEFQGLGHFQNRVLYAKLLMDDSYERLHLLAESVKKHFASASIFSTDSRKDFNPHLTVAKIDFKKRQNKFIKKIDPSLYKDFNNQYFGSQKISGIQLLSMLDPKNEVGYYSGNEIFFSAFNPAIGCSSLNKALETEEKKKNVKEIINALMKEKLK